MNPAMNPTITDADIICDPLDDEVSLLLREMKKHKTLTREWVRLKKDVINKMSAGKKVRFTSDKRLFRLSCVGDSLVCRVPKNKKGYLSPLRNRLIRLVCVGSIGRHVCEYIAAPLKSPTLKQREI